MNDIALMSIPPSLADLFDTLGIIAPLHEHPPLHTVQDAETHWARLDGASVKNLLLQDLDQRLWLVVMPGAQRISTRLLADLLGSKRLSFASAETLRETLRVEPGAVTPLAVINDHALRVRAVLHQGLMSEPALLLHPLRNTATVQLPPADLLRVMRSRHRLPQILDLSPAFES